MIQTYDLEVLLTLLKLSHRMYFVQYITAVILRWDSHLVQFSTNEIITFCTNNPGSYILY